MLANSEKDSRSARWLLNIIYADAFEQTYGHVGMNTKAVEEETDIELEKLQERVMERLAVSYARMSIAFVA